MSLLGGLVGDGLINLEAGVSGDGIEADIGIGGSSDGGDNSGHGDTEADESIEDGVEDIDPGMPGSGNGSTGGNYSGNGASDGSANGNHKAFAFQVSNNEVIALSELIDGELRPVTMQPNEFYVLDGRDIVRNKGMHFGTEITRFVDIDEDGLFIRDSESWLIDLERGGPFPSLSGPLRFSGTDSNDFLSVREGTLSFGGAGADAFVIREAGHLQILDFNKNEGDKLVFDLAIGLQSKEQLSSYITDIAYENNNFVVSFGSTASITLIGVNPGQIGWEDAVIMS